MDPILLEKLMIEYLTETLRKQKGMSYDDIAGKVYGTENMQRSRLRLYHLRKADKDGNRKRLLLDDFVSICKALDENPAEILGYVIRKAKTEEKLS